MGEEVKYRINKAKEELADKVRKRKEELAQKIRKAQDELEQMVTTTKMEITQMEKTLEQKTRNWQTADGTHEKVTKQLRSVTDKLSVYQRRIWKQQEVCDAMQDSHGESKPG